MSILNLLILIFSLGALAYVLARAKALKTAGGNRGLLHSLPRYYGLNAFILATLPALLLITAWLICEPQYFSQTLKAQISTLNENRSEASLISFEITRISNAVAALQNAGKLAKNASNPVILEQLGESGFILDESTQLLLGIAKAHLASKAHLRLILSLLALSLASAGGFYAYARSKAEYRARNAFENAVLGILILTSVIAILTTLGIVFSMFFETISFFENHPWQDFFFGIVWSPNFRGGSELSVLPLLWGTVYISLVALLVSVPLGLFAAIYMAEYASPVFRAWSKPMLEILAGIPTIVYGLFALTTVGPIVRDWIAIPTGLGNSSSSVLTAGVVMGIMLIPFVSSLSDDVINAVPQTMRDGSLGLGATPSETIRFVVIPAALPGIVASILLAASRAIGETMIVVLGAGAAAAQLNAGFGALINPFEAMTTITVKILSQLTGDTDFNSPETLVAFALGLTLFIITLGLNILALHVVRKYQERYE